MKGQNKGNVKKKRYFCWDKDAVEQDEGLEVRMHKPVERNVALRGGE